MKITKFILEGAKLAALLGAVALVVWGMPDYVPEPNAENGNRVVQLRG